MIPLTKYSDDDLIKELTRRKNYKKIKPLREATPDFTGLIDLCRSHVDDIANGNEDEDTKQYIYEEAMMAVYGKDIFTWINERT
jgi:hypothetical protein